MCFRMLGSAAERVRPHARAYAGVKHWSHPKGWSCLLLTTRRTCLCTRLCPHLVIAQVGRNPESRPAIASYRSQQTGICGVIRVCVWGDMDSKKNTGNTSKTEKNASMWVTCERDTLQGILGRKKRQEERIEKFTEWSPIKKLLTPHSPQWKEGMPANRSHNVNEKWTNQQWEVEDGLAEGRKDPVCPLKPAASFQPWGTTSKQKSSREEIASIGAKVYDFIVHWNWIKNRDKNATIKKENL